MALSELETLLPRLTKLSPAKKILALYKLRSLVSEEDFRHLATLLNIDLSKSESPKRWVSVNTVDEKIEDEGDIVEDLIEVDVEILEILEDDEYVGKKIVERIWKSNTL